MEDSLGHSQKFNKIARLLAGVHAFVLVNIKGRVDIISEAFEVAENV